MQKVMTMAMMKVVCTGGNMNQSQMVDRIVNCAIAIAIVAVIVLKIVGVITIPWIWLLSPIWILLGLGIILGLVLGIWCLIDNYKYEKKKEKEYERY